MRCLCDLNTDDDTACPSVSAQSLGGSHTYWAAMRPAIHRNGRTSEA